MGGSKTKPKPTKSKIMPGSKAPVAIFPHLHSKILRTLGNSINPKPSFFKGKQRSIDDYSTFIMGTFTCENDKW